MGIGIPVMAGHLTHWGRDKMTSILQTKFLNWFFVNETVSISIKIALNFVFGCPINNDFSISLDNSLAPTRQQAIIWASDGLGYRCIYVSLALSEVRGWGVTWPGLCFSMKTVFPSIGICIMKIKQMWDHLVFIMGIPTLVRWHFYLEMASLVAITAWIIHWYLEYSKHYWDLIVFLM